MAQQYPGPGMGAGGGGGGGSSSQFGDTTYTKVFVGGLAWETQRDTMRRYFEQFGEILEAVVITDKNTGRSKGYGFVTFRDPEAARRACADPTPVIDGRRANCNLASLGAHRSRPATPQHGGRFRQGSPYPGGPQGGGHAYGAGATFNQPVPYAYQQGFPYSPYGYPPYPPEYYPPNVYNPYLAPQFPAIYGSSGTLGSPTMHPHPLSQSMHGASGFPPQQGYGMQGPQVLSYGSPTMSTTSSLPHFGGAVPISTPLQSTGTPGHMSPGTIVAGPGPTPQFVVAAPSQTQFTPSAGSEQPSG